jgi:glycine oxidase
MVHGSPVDRAERGAAAPDRPNLIRVMPAKGGTVDRTAPPDVVIVGGGLIGLSIAWRAAGLGLRVQVVDPEPGRAASYAAAGMLAPVTEAHYNEERLLGLNLASSRRYPEFVGELEEESGLSTGYRQTGTLVVALDGDDLAALAELYAFQRSLDLAVEQLSGRECRRMEPLLAPGTRGALLVAGDHQVDNRRLTAALLRAVELRGVTLRRDRVSGVTTAHGRVTGVRTAGGTVIAAGEVVLAAGCWSGTIQGLPPEVVPPVRPVKGQTVRLRIPAAFAPFLSRNVRGLVKGTHVYLVPRADGELVIGATQEEMGYDTQVTAGGVYELLRDARELVPAITELPLVETHAGLRPGTPDNAPLLGPSAVSGLVLATGHFRNGVLLTPVTADVIATYLAEGVLPDLARPFSPDRFAVHEVPR